jgi:D-alanyl-D-alanine carboxypeptidase
MRACFLVFCLLTIGCSDKGPAAGDTARARDAFFSEAGKHDAAGETRPDGTRPDIGIDALPPACAAQDLALQSMLDANRSAGVRNAFLAVKDQNCGTRLYLSGDPTTAATTSLWRIASITKTFTSVAILSLIKEGVVSLDDPLSKWVPNVPNTTGVTVQMLLNNRSGIYNYTEDTTFDPTKPSTPQQLVDLATAKHLPYFAPDAGFNYSNTNYVLLGMILEAATGQKAGAVLHARAIDKAGLSSTLFDGYDTIAPSSIARGFKPSGADITFFYDPSAFWTAGQMVATGADLVNWAATLYGTNTLLDANQQTLLTSTASNMGNSWNSKFSWLVGAKYGLGVVLTDPTVTSNGGQGYGHCGVIEGYVTCAFYFPAHKTAVAVGVNRIPKSYIYGADVDPIFVGALQGLFP